MIVLDAAPVYPCDAEIPVTPREGRASEIPVTQISFSMQIVAIIVSCVISTGLAATAAVWAAQQSTTAEQAKLQSDVRDILTRMQMQSEMAATQSRIREQQDQSMTDSINEMKRRLELVQMQYAELSKVVQLQRR